MIEQLIERMSEYGTRPSLIERIEDSSVIATFQTDTNSTIENIVFFGTPLNSATNYTDAKYLIQAYIKREDGTEATGFANGLKKFNQAWSNRANLSYKITENFTTSFLSPTSNE